MLDECGAFAAELRALLGSAKKLSRQAQGESPAQLSREIISFNCVGGWLSTVCTRYMLPSDCSRQAYEYERLRHTGHFFLRAFAHL